MDLLIDEQGVFLSDRHDIAINTVKSLKKYLNSQNLSQPFEEEIKLDLVGVSDGAIEIPSFWQTAYRNLNLAKTNLPNVNKELLQLNKSINNSTLTLGKNATETRTKHIIQNATGILHFASHGFDNPIAPAYSALVLKADDSNDGLLQAREISKLKTQALLVVLASCSSAKGGLSGLYGYSSGLAESFIHAGAKTVIGTLWDVKDKQTYQLMQWFYQGLSHHLTASKALSFAKKQARLSGWKTYDWAGFILLGQTDLKLNLIAKESMYWKIITALALLIFIIVLYKFRKKYQC
jgi:CHAT domain-containing protein